MLSTKYTNPVKKCVCGFHSTTPASMQCLSHVCGGVSLHSHIGAAHKCRGVGLRLEWTYCSQFKGTVLGYLVWIKYLLKLSHTLWRIYYASTLCKCHSVILADHCLGVDVIATRKEKVSWELRNRRVFVLISHRWSWWYLVLLQGF